MTRKWLNNRSSNNGLSGIGSIYPIWALYLTINGKKRRYLGTRFHSGIPQILELKILINYTNNGLNVAI